MDALEVLANLVTVVTGLVAAAGILKWLFSDSKDTITLSDGNEETIPSDDNGKSSPLDAKAVWRCFRKVKEGVTYVLRYIKKLVRSSRWKPEIGWFVVLCLVVVLGYRVNYLHSLQNCTVTSIEGDALHIMDCTGKTLPYAFDSQITATSVADLDDDGMSETVLVGTGFRGRDHSGVFLWKQGSRKPRLLCRVGGMTGKHYGCSGSFNVVSVHGESDLWGKGKAGIVVVANHSTFIRPKSRC